MGNQDGLSPSQWVQVTFAFCIGLAVLLVGSAMPDERLELAGIPLPPLVFGCAAIAVIALPVPRRLLRLLCLSHGLVALLAVTVLWSYQPDYGAWKLANLIGSSVIAVLCFYFVIERAGWRRFALLWVSLLSLLLAGALVFKTIVGFWDRDVPFLLNGPIVFARLMGIGAVLSFVAFRSYWRHLLVAVFFLAVCWTFSNGPVLSMLLVLPFLYWRNGDANDRRIFGFAAALAAVAVTVAVYRFSVNVDLGRLSLILQLASGGVGDLERFGSANARLSGYLQTFELIAQHPWGVGLGGWRGSVVLGDLYYPHNLILELISEGGVVLGGVALLPFCAFALGKRPGVVFTGAFLFLSQLFSGDLLDARYLLCFSTLALLAVAWPAGSTRQRLSLAVSAR